MKDLHTTEPPGDLDGPGVKAESFSADESFARTLIQFFVVPAVVVAVCVGIFFFFAWLVSDPKSGVDYLQEVRTGSATRRWQAAFELSKIITMNSEKKRMEGLVPEMITAFEEASGDDPRVRHYLALSLGHLGDRQASPALIAALDDPDATTRLYSAWALGNLGDDRAVGPLLEKLSDDDPGVRKMTVYALGALGNSRAVTPLRVALSDPDRDVSWNAAVALAQLGDPSGEQLLLKILDQEFLDGITDMTEAQKLLAMESAIRASSRVSSDALTVRLREISTQHANLGMRKIALEALDAEKPH